MTVGTKVDSEYLESVYSQCHNFSVGENPVSEATTTQLTGGPARTEAVEARNWIERQLRWERTLGSLRGGRSDERNQQAA